MDARLGRHLADIVEGHWLDFQEFDRRENFISGDTFGATNQRFHVGLVALFVRLVDLFDIANDRTPEAARVADPTNNEISQIEWIKHSCVSPVSVDATDHGDRRLVVRGEVLADNSDARAVKGHVWCGDYHAPAPLIWAELESLRLYCEDQLRKAVDGIRKRLTAVSFDLSPVLEWRVAAKNFHAVSIRFEFARDAMFRYLTSELYEGDTHVFLRELLQNAIDAIRLRRAIDEKAKRPRHAHPVIYFKVKHGDDGDATITCRDYGAGMDEYIVRHYLSVAGSSYYTSTDFQALHCGFEPISQFGIGLLSCFMVAERVEIRTRRVQSGSEDIHPLHIDIPRIGKPFHIYADETLSEPGTSVTVHVRGEKLREQWRLAHAQEAAQLEPDEKPPTVPLEITDYLKIVAGFVRQPIVVDERDTRTVIIHPDYRMLPEVIEDGNELPRLEREAKSASLQWAGVHCLERGYRWMEVLDAQLDPEELAALSDETVDVVQDLAHALSSTPFEGSEGWISFPKPLSDDEEFRGRYLWNRYSGYVDKEYPVIFNFGGTGTERVGVAEAPSSSRQLETQVFRDGLLVGNTSTPDIPYLWRDSRLRPRVILNLSHRKVTGLDPSRRMVRGWGKNWAASLWKAFENWDKPKAQIRCIIQETSANTDAARCERFFRLGRVAALFGLPPHWLAEVTQGDDFPVPTIEADGSFRMRTEAEFQGARLWEFPNNGLFDPHDVFVGGESSVTRWRSDVPCIPAIRNDFSGAVGVAWEACHLRFCVPGFPAVIRWLKPPVPWRHLVAQQGHDFGKDDSDLKRILTKPKKEFGGWWATIGSFEPPFVDRITADGMLNRNHPFLGWILAIVKRLAEANETGTINSEFAKTVNQAAWKVVSKIRGDQFQQESLYTYWNQLLEAIASAQLEVEAPPPPPTEAELAPTPAFDLNRRIPYDQKNDEQGDADQINMNAPTQDWGTPVSADWKPVQKRQPKRHK